MQMVKAIMTFFRVLLRWVTEGPHSKVSTGNSNEINITILQFVGIIHLTNT
jgi:hypothetical protein